MLRRFTRFLGASLILGGLLLAMPLTTLAADQPQKITVTILQAALIAFGYYLSQGPWLFGFGFFTIYRPLAAGLMVGLILGDPAKGTLIGAAINLIYLGFISAGGSIPGDPALAGWVGTTIALAANLDYAQALAIAVPIGLLGTIIWNFRMTGDVVFLHYADRKAEEGNINEVGRANWLYPQIYLFILTFIPVFIFAYQGLDAVTQVLTSLPTWVLNGLAIAGGVLPAIGIAMNMRFIFRGAVIPYFFLGYTLMYASNKTLSIVIIGVLGLVLAYLHVYFVGNRPTGTPAGTPAPATTPTTATASQGGV